MHHGACSACGTASDAPRAILSCLSPHALRFQSTGMLCCDFSQVCSCLQVEADEQGSAAQLPCSALCFALALLVQRCADSHSAVCSRAMTSLSKALTAVLDSQGEEAWLQPVATALCNANRLVLDAGQVKASVADDTQQKENQQTCAPASVFQIACSSTWRSFPPSSCMHAEVCVQPLSPTSVVYGHLLEY